jgi:hypothetical protein
MSHPLLPSNKFLTTQTYQEIIQTACVAPSFTGGIAFYLSQQVTKLITSVAPLNFFHFLPSMLVYGVSGNNQTLFQKISWIAPVSGIVTVTWAAYELYALSTSCLVNGAICGIHGLAMMFFSYAPGSAGALGLITLKGNIKDLLLNPEKFQHLSYQKRSSMDSKAETAASAAFLASSISLTILLQNPILANGIAYPLAAVTKIATMRLLQELAIRQT